MALAGNIKEFGLADIFQIVSLQQKTGELIVAKGNEKVTILLEGGFIVGGDASGRPIEERVQQTLARSQAVSKFQLTRALETQKKTLQPLWTVLVETNAVSTDVLRNVLAQQIHETVYYVLRWTDGEYRFEPKKQIDYDRQLINPINTEFLVMEGFRITDEWSEIEKQIPSLQQLVRRVEHAPLPADLSEAEKKVYQSLSADKTIQEVIDTCQLGEFDTCQTIYDLMKKKLVEHSAAKAGKAPKGRRLSIGIGDIAIKAATLLITLAVLIGIGFGISYLPQDFSLIHKPGLNALGSLKPYTAQSEVRFLAQIATRYFLTFQQIPQSFEELQAKALLPATRPKDPWGQPYIFQPAQKQLVIVSSGQDETPETVDDVKMTVSF